MHPPNAYSLLFNPCESLCPSVCPFVTKIDVAFLSLRHNSLQVFVIFTHSLFRHTLCWDLLLYQSDVNLILNDDFAHCSQHFQTKFCQRFRSSYMSGSLYSLDFNFLSNNNLVHFQPKTSNIMISVFIVNQMSTLF